MAVGVGTLSCASRCGGAGGNDGSRNVMLAQIGKERRGEISRQRRGRRIGSSFPAMGDINFRVPHKAQIGEVGQFLCDKLDEVWGHIGDGDCEAFDGGCARGVLQLHLGVFSWFQYEGDLNDAWECGEEGLGGAEVDDRNVSDARERDGRRGV